MPRCSCGKEIDSPRQTRCKDCQREYDKNYRDTHREEMNRKNKKWRDENNWSAHLAKQYQELRLKALQKVARSDTPICVYCGCDDIRLLEINHIKGGGRKEIAEKKVGFYKDIVSGKRSVEDLNIACKVSNAKHYLELKYGLLPFTIKWK